MQTPPRHCSSHGTLVFQGPCLWRFVRQCLEWRESLASIGCAARGVAMFESMVFSVHCWGWVGWVAAPVHVRGHGMMASNRFGICWKFAARLQKMKA